MYNSSRSGSVAAPECDKEPSVRASERTGRLGNATIKDSVVTTTGRASLEIRAGRVRLVESRSVPSKRSTEKSVSD